jgi:hypothetical protein
MYPDYDRKNSTSPKIATLLVVAMGIMALLAPPYVLSSTQEAFAIKSDDKDDQHHSEKHDDKNKKKHEDKKGDNGDEIPPAYIEIDGERSRLQLENDNFLAERIADYDIDPQGTISFGEEFNLLVRQASSHKDVESAELTVCYDEECGNDDFWISRELVDVNDEKYWYIETHVIDAPDEVGDGFTANEVGFPIYMWWTVEFTDGTTQTYVAIVHLEGDECEEHGWVDSSSGTRCFDPEE